MKKFFRDILTENDNKSYCWARVVSSLAFLFLVIGTCYSTYLTKSFAMTDFANAMMQILFGSGAAIGAKQITHKMDTKAPDPER